MKLLNIYINATKGWNYRDQLAQLGFTYRGCKGTVSYTVKVPETQSDDEARKIANTFIAKAKASMPEVVFSTKEYTTVDRDAKAHKHPSAKPSVKKQVAKALPVDIDPALIAAILAALKSAA